jgi:hypothetical protein
MTLVRRLVLVFALIVLTAPCVRASATTTVEGAPLVIMLEHHWVVEVSGHRFGVIQFDTPMTTILLGGVDFDVPAPAILVLLPLLAVPVLAAVGLVMHARRRRLEFAGLE